MIAESLINYRNLHPQLGLPRTREEFNEAPKVTYEQLFESGYIDLLKSKSDTSCILRTGGTSSLSYKILPSSHHRFKNNDRAVSQQLLLDLIRYKGRSLIPKLLLYKAVFLSGNMFEDGDQPVRYVSNSLINERGWLGHLICPVAQSIYDGLAYPDNKQKLRAIAKCYHGRQPLVVSGVPSVIVQFAQVRYELYNKPLLPEVLITGGCRIEPYTTQLKTMFGQNILIIPYYNATEATIAYQPSEFRSNDDYATLQLQPDCGVYYELIDPMDPAIIISLDQAKPNTAYILLLSTYDGLCRYQIGDIIEFSDCEKLYFHIVGRTSEYIDIANEHTQIEHIRTAIKAIDDDQIGHYCVFPLECDGVWGYHRVIEFDPSHAQNPNPQILASKLDTLLQQANDNYASKRSSLTLAESRVTIVDSGTFDTIISNLNQRNHSTQSKLLNLYPTNDNPLSRYLSQGS